MAAADAPLGSLRTWAALGIALWVTVGCGPHDESLGCAELVVSCPGGAPEQQWWLAKDHTSGQMLQPQHGVCGSWLAYMEEGALARFDNVDLGTREGETRLRVLVAADDKVTNGGTLSVYTDTDTTPAVMDCPIGTTGGWFNWMVVDCGPMPLTGVHNLTFKFFGSKPYSFNFAAFGVVRSGSPDCTVTGPRRE